MNINLASERCDFGQLESYLDASLDEAAANNLLHPILPGGDLPVFPR